MLLGIALPFFWRKLGASLYGAFLLFFSLSYLRGGENPSYVWQNGLMLSFFIASYTAALIFEEEEELRGQSEASVRAQALEKDLSKAVSDSKEKDQALEMLKRALEERQTEASERAQLLEKDLSIARSESKEKDRALEMLKRALEERETEASERAQLLEKDLSIARSESKEKDRALEMLKRALEERAAEISERAQALEAAFGERERGVELRAAEASVRAQALEKDLSKARSDSKEKDRALEMWKAALEERVAKASERAQLLEKDLSRARSDSKEKDRALEMLKAALEEHEAEASERTQALKTASEERERDLSWKATYEAKESELEQANRSLELLKCEAFERDKAIEQLKEALEAANNPQAKQIKTLEARYLELRAQFEEKSKVLAATRRELFLSQGEAYVLGQKLATSRFCQACYTSGEEMGALAHEIERLEREISDLEALISQILAQ